MSAASAADISIVAKEELVRICNNADSYDFDELVSETLRKYERELNDLERNMDQKMSEMEPNKVERFLQLTEENSLTFSFILQNVNHLESRVLEYENSLFSKHKRLQKLKRRKNNLKIVQDEFTILSSLLLKQVQFIISLKEIRSKPTGFITAAILFFELRDNLKSIDYLCLRTQKQLLQENKYIFDNLLTLAFYNLLKGNFDEEFQLKYSLKTLFKSNKFNINQTLLLDRFLKGVDKQNFIKQLNQVVKVQKEYPTLTNFRNSFETNLVEKLFLSKTNVSATEISSLSIVLSQSSISKIKKHFFRTQMIWAKSTLLRKSGWNLFTKDSLVYDETNVDILFYSVFSHVIKSFEQLSIPLNAIIGLYFVVVLSNFIDAQTLNSIYLPQQTFVSPDITKLRQFLNSFIVAENSKAVEDVSYILTSIKQYKLIINTTETVISWKSQYDVLLLIINSLFLTELLVSNLDIAELVVTTRILISKKAMKILLDSKQPSDFSTSLKEKILTVDWNSIAGNEVSTLREYCHSSVEDLVALREQVNSIDNAKLREVMWRLALDKFFEDLLRAFLFVSQVSPIGRKAQFTDLQFFRRTLMDFYGEFTSEYYDRAHTLFSLTELEQKEIPKEWLKQNMKFKYSVEEIKAMKS